MLGIKSILCTFLACVSLCGASYTKQHIRLQFEKDFHDRCDKYPFVQDYYNKLENPPDKYLIFVYHEKNLRNGGIGDRFGGMISAIAMSLRYNRTLLIKASNGFHQSFRPYHPIDIKSENPQYLWENWPQWTNFTDINEQIKAAQNDEDELENLQYDMGDCVSNREEGFTDEQTHRCAMDDGDVPQQVILFKSNRCYLCRWNKNLEYKAFKEFKKVLLGPDYQVPDKPHRPYLNKLGVDPSADLFEVAGCMMRLAIWPTDTLWDNVDKLYEEYQSTLGQQLQPQIGNTSSQQGADEEDEEVPKKKSKKSKKSKKKGKKSKKAKKHNKKTLQENEESIAAADSVVESNNSSAVVVLQQPVYQIGLHMRCGDKHSYFNLKLHTDGYSRHACIVERPNLEMRESSTEHEKSIYLNAGNPLTIGQCGRTVYDQYVEAEQKAQRKRAREAKKLLLESASAEVGADGSVKSAVPAAVVAAPKHPVFSSLVYITSDNIIAAQQMNTTINHPHTLITPQGCHIELDPSVECHLFTVSYWFMLSLSDVLVTQTFGNFNLPTSSFSRYAGIYGLKVNPFRSGRFCDERFPNTIISHTQQSNWFC